MGMHKIHFESVEKAMSVWNQEGIQQSSCANGNGKHILIDQQICLPYKQIKTHYSIICTKCNYKPNSGNDGMFFFYIWIKFKLK